MSMPLPDLEGDADRRRPRPVRTFALATALLSTHAVLIGLSLPRNAVTIDEVVHLPAGMSYWHHGVFWCYHHNPPFIRLLFALPAVVSGVPTDYRHFQPVAGSRSPDSDLGHDFMWVNRNHYLQVFMLGRVVVAGLSVLGGLIVFVWARALFGDAGGLISLGLWAFCPNILAHGGLVTPDIGATVVGLLASYQFWRYLRRPTLVGAVLAGILLGLAQASKFSLVVLPAVWAVAAAYKLWSDRRHASPTTLGSRRALIHAAVLGCVALVTLNDVYLGEGVGLRLDSFEFRSKLLTRAADEDHAASGSAPVRVNRFKDTWLGRCPMPFPEHYLLGFDAQTFDVDSGNYYKYLRGELRHEEPGWYHYYLYCLAVKTPIGTLFLMGLAAAAIATTRRCRSDGVTELLLSLLAATVVITISSQRGLNSHLRYILPAYPFAFIWAGRLGPFVAGSRARTAVVVAALSGTAASTLAVHPDYLAYFNEVAGGPGRGLDHLADSNIDWGQGLVGLRDWLEENAPGRTIGLAYFGTMFPEVLEIPYELPPFGPEIPETPGGDVPVDFGPIPGLQAVSANYLLGIPFPAPNAWGGQSMVPRDAYRYFRRFRPKAIVAKSIYVYDISLTEANRVREDMGLPPLERTGGAP